MNQTGVSVVLVSELEMNNVMEVAKECPSLKAVIQTGDATEDTREAAKACGLSLYTVAEVEEAGRQDRKEPEPPKADDISTFCYTSGTTGDPKARAPRTRGPRIPPAPRHPPPHLRPRAGRHDLARQLDRRRGRRHC